MKSLLLLSILVLSNYSFSQVHYRTLDHNNASALISDAGTFFRDFDGTEVGYEIPKNSGIKAIYTTNFWFGGISSTGDTNYILGGIPGLGQDLFNGPYSSNGAYNDSGYQSDWDSSIWMFSQEEIDNFNYYWESCVGPSANQTDCANAIQPTNDFLMQLYTWPGNGNITNGEEYWMAPYYDNPNGPSGSDGVYNPDDGDYPLIKGCKAVYLIQNDDAGIKSYSGTASMGMEVHYMFYQYKTWDYLDNTTFVDVVAINRGNDNFSNFAYGLLGDADLGNYSDDYIGSDSTNNMMYFYNSDNFDEDWGGGPGYGNTPAALGFVALENDVTSITPYEYSDNPWIALDGKFGNGQNWMHPDGYPTKYVFSGNPNNLGEWSQVSAPNDRRGIMSTMHGAFNSGETIQQTYAIIFSNAGDNLQNAQNILDLAPQVKSFYINQSNIPCQGATWGIEESSNIDILIYPNPTKGLIQIENANELEMSIIVMDLTGQEVEPHFVSSQQFIQMDFSKNANGVYLIHVTTKQGSRQSRIVVQK